MKTLITTALAAAAFAATGLSAAFAEQPGAFTFSVQRASLESAASIEAAYDRLNREAARYCAEFQLNTRAETEACVAEVVEAVVRQVGQPRLSQHHIAMRQNERGFAGLDPR